MSNLARNDKNKFQRHMAIFGNSTAVFLVYAIKATGLPNFSAVTPISGHTCICGSLLVEQEATISGEQLKVMVLFKSTAKIKSKYTLMFYFDYSV